MAANASTAIVPGTGIAETATTYVMFNRSPGVSENEVSIPIESAGWIPGTVVIAALSTDEAKGPRACRS